MAELPNAEMPIGNGHFRRGVRGLIPRAVHDTIIAFGKHNGKIGHLGMVCMRKCYNEMLTEKIIHGKQAKI